MRGFLATAFVFLGTSAQAATAIYSFDIRADEAYGFYGSPEAASLRLGIDLAGYSPGGTFGKGALKSLSFTAGNTSWGLSDFAAISFAGNWNDNPNDIFFSGMAAEKIGGPRGGPGSPLIKFWSLLEDGPLWTGAGIVGNAACYNVDCVGSVMYAQSAMDANFNANQPSPVPLPPAAGLLVIGLAALAFVRRYRDTY